MTGDSFPMKVEALLDDTGLCRADLAGILNVSRATITGWMKGRHKPSSRHLKGLSEFFAIKVHWFKEDTQGYPPAPRWRIRPNHGVPSPMVPRDPKRDSVDERASRDALERRRENQPIEVIKDNLIQVPDEQVLELLTEIETSLREKNSYRVGALCDRLKGVLKIAAQPGPVQLRAVSGASGKDSPDVEGEGKDPCTRIG